MKKDNDLFTFWVKNGWTVKEVEGNLQFTDDPEYKESLELLKEYERIKKDIGRT